ncbi:thiopurine S-methyltransferase [Natronospira proteinivora]|uniref:Thiopurine S-methyltransferase n=1 Tax=Natronospira proteinivora TaxID=1807133 RepID=A0ABT1G4T0_9GAMM|nr:thiopurine S-methyltransferase [Natronospira proteinivora]MCP1726298.1 thiopurine S-methyltransferase [Natronospira proteinivora]
MKAAFWHERWQQGQIGFHQAQVNHNLKTLWQELRPAPEEGVLVPLCGKAHDMAWLQAQGHAVTGVELSPVACREFFAERGLTPAQSRHGRFQRFSHGRIQLLCGDFWDLKAADLAGVSLFYDRAALIALPPAMREDYVAHLARVLSPGSRGLLISLDYSDGSLQGPPFNVSDEEVFRLFQPDFKLSRLLQRALGTDDPLSRRGLTHGTESVFYLERRN